MRIPAAIAGLLLSLVLSLAASPAQAASTIRICNSPHSEMAIEPYEADRAGKDWLNPGQCETLPNGHGQARVEIGWRDAFSYRLRDARGNYGACHDGFGWKISNPPNSAKKVYYRTWYDYGCD